MSDHRNTYGTYEHYEEFLKALCREEWKAWELFLRKFTPIAKRFLIYKFDTEALVEQSVGESTVKMLRALRRFKKEEAGCVGRFPNEKAFMSYWLVVNKNTMLTQIVTGLKRAEREGEYEYFSIKSDQKPEAPGEQGNGYSIQDLMGEFIEKIDNEMHRAVYQDYLKNVPYDQIAETRGQTMANVKVIIHRLNKKFIAYCAERAKPE